MELRKKLELEPDIHERIMSRFEWIQVQNRKILYVNFEDCPEQDFISSAYLVRAALNSISEEYDVCLLINFTKLPLTPKMIYHATQNARYRITRTQRIAAIGLSPFVTTLVRMAKAFITPQVRAFATYENALDFLTEDLHR
jgi:hypothetical protein